MASGFTAQQENIFFFVGVVFFIFFENFGIFANLVPQSRTTSENLETMISKFLLFTKG